ncbi:MAG: 4Fe-4S binding protein [Desulfobacterales bacterium]|nr:4Fe-4S binding protein [Desulfobacterales bacterium]
MLDKKLCKKCKTCVEGCPTKAMQMDEFPGINEERCIRCLCCQELCPESAWKTRGLRGRFQGSRT